jgi:hypothetical protein
LKLEKIFIIYDSDVRNALFFMPEIPTFQPG